MIPNHEREQAGDDAVSRPFAVWLLALLAAMLPFDLQAPLLRFGGEFGRFSIGLVRFSNLELVQLAFLAAAFGSMLASARARTAFSTLGRRFTLAGVVFAALALASALFAVDHHAEAARLAMRHVMGVLTALAAASVLRLAPRFGTSLLFRALALAAVLGAVLALLEPLLGAGNPLYTLFREAPTLVGGRLRVSGPFQHATQASLFFEAVLPLVLVLSATTRSRVESRVALASAMLLIAASVFSLTRVGLVVMAVEVAAILIASRAVHALRVPARVAFAALTGCVLAAAFVSPTFRARFRSENDLAWYGAQYEAPATLLARTGELLEVSIRARNTGKAAWESGGAHPYALGARWLSDERDDAEILWLEGSERVPERVSPGHVLATTLRLMPPSEPGRYRLAIGMMQEDLTFFRYREVPDVLIAVEVTRGLPAFSPPLRYTSRPEPTSVPRWTVSRRELWIAALRMVRERPLLGYGPDLYRLHYGRILGRAPFDTRLGASSLYLHLAAEVGLLGLAGFVWFVALPLFKGLRGPTTELRTFALVLCVSGQLLHGVLDYFLAVHTPALLFWISLGALASQRAEPECADAVD